MQKVLALQAVSFQWEREESLGKDIGFIAQDVQEIFPEVVFTNPVDGYMGINYSRFPAILANAIQEQQQIIESQEARLTELEEQVSRLLAGTPSAKPATDAPVDQKRITLTDRYEEAPLLYQNVPNPFSQTTAIRYYIPEGTTEAELVFMSTGNGKMLKTVAVDATGYGEIEVNVADLPSGTYSYTLIIDGQQTLSRQMVLAK